MLDKNKFDKFVTLDRKLFDRYSTLCSIGINLDEMSDNLIPELTEELFWAYFPETKDKAWNWQVNGKTIKMNLYDWYNEFHSWAFDNPDYEWIYEQLTTLMSNQ